MALPDPIIKRRDGRLTIRLPARPMRGLKWVLLILFAVPFIAAGGFMATGFAAPQFLGLHVVAGSLQAGWGNRIVGSVIGVFTVLLTAPIVMKGLIGRFGHSEIVVTRGRIRSIERVGWIFLTSSRPLATLTRLDIVKPPFNEKTDGEPLMNLEAYFSDAMPFGLARLYPADALKPIARELLGAIPNHGGSQKVVFAGPPPLSRVRSVPAIVPPPRRKLELSRMSLERSDGSTRVTIAPYSWFVAALPLVIALTIIFFMLKARNAQWVSNLAWATNLRGVDLVRLLIVLIPLALGAAGTLTMRTRHEFEASGDGLRVESQSPLQRSLRQWPAAQIDRLFVEVQPGHSQKGGSRTVRRLMLVLKNGKRERLLGDRGQQNLDWICQTLNAGLQEAGISAAWPSFNPGRSSVSQGLPRGLGIFFALFASLFFILGWTMAIKQDLRLRHAVPVQATVTSITTVPTHTRGGADIGSHTVWRYRYSVNGRSYESVNLFATDMTGAVEQGISERFLANMTQGQSFTARYEPGDPTTVFVLRERLFSPYFFVFMAMVFIAVGLSIALAPRRPKDAPADAPAPLDLVRRRTQTLFWILSGAAAIGHYLLQWPTTWHLDFLITAGIWLFVSNILLNRWRSGVARRLPRHRRLDRALAVGEDDRAIVLPMRVDKFDHRAETSAASASNFDVAARTPQRYRLALQLGVELNHVNSGDAVHYRLKPARGGRLPRGFGSWLDQEAVHLVASKSEGGMVALSCHSKEQKTTAGGDAGTHQPREKPQEARDRNGGRNL